MNEVQQAKRTKQIDRLRTRSKRIANIMQMACTRSSKTEAACVPDAYSIHIACKYLWTVGCNHSMLFAKPNRRRKITMTDPLADHLKTVPKVKKAGRLRALMPEIERQLSAGARYEDIVAHLNAGGLEITFSTFKSYLYRSRLDQRLAQAQLAEPGLSPVRRVEPEQNTDCNTATNSEPTEDSNPPSELPEPDTGPIDNRSLADILDAKKSDAWMDQFFDRRPRLLIGRNRTKP
jgi:hypothetical protein